MTPRVLIIAGSDSGGGAGIQADIKTVTMLGGHAMTAITALTAQNTLGVQAVMPVPVAMVIAQIDACISDIGVDAVKIGMIGSAEIAHAVADVLEKNDVPIVFDPVMVATSGDVLADAATIAAFERLMRISVLTTPNRHELAVLGGKEAMWQHCGALLLKGGHGDGDDISDTLVESHGKTDWYARRVDTRHTHGTGCTLASAIATGLGQNMTMQDAVDRAILFVRTALAHAPGVGAGQGPMGHAMGRIPFYDALAATDASGWDAAAFAARWS
ncbi:bifunctional hydroxymethylpyrimidine kinase/phosphomethylpyrimidine kinase [Sphingomonas sp. RB3P16]|uniref:bifunctional hydroxymethylpyrimidine kinase/phosphomethylpyrimidine kinase n=1 Tax=Parasphingomonas frigoris TaxID=3096163 RepID=UPI002FCB55F0